MITAIVRFKLPANVTLDAATELFKGSAPKYQNLPGLVRKYYLYGEGTGGGVYLWKSRADAEKVYTAEWRAMIAQRYGAEPEITFFESPVIVDNDAQSVQGNHDLWWLANKKWKDPAVRRWHESHRPQARPSGDGS